MRAAYYIWSLAERFGASAVSLVAGIVLAGLLTPDDFGLVAMLGVFTSLTFVLIDCGMADGLLREPSPTTTDFSTLFFFNMAVALVLAVLFVACSPWVAAYFHRPELQPVTAALGLGPVFTGLSLARATRLRSMLRYRLLACVNIGSIVLAAAVAVVMAICGMRYWALVELQVGFSFFYWMLLVCTSRWWLRWEFDRRRFRLLWRFGSSLLMSTIAIQVSQNILAMLLGRHFSATQAGHLNQAQKLQQAPISALETGLSNAALVTIAKRDRGQDEEYYRVFVIFTFVLTMSCAIGMVMSRPVIEVLFPERWMPSVPFLRLLLCWAAVYPLTGFLSVMLKLRGRTSPLFRVTLLERAGIIVAALALWPMGAMWVIASFVPISGLAVLALMWLCSRYSHLRVTALMRAYAVNLMCGIVAALPAWWLCRHLSGWTAMLAGLALWLVVALPLTVWRIPATRAMLKRRAFA